jgi:hypothetical protein
MFSDAFSLVFAYVMQVGLLPYVLLGLLVEWMDCVRYVVV